MEKLFKTNGSFAKWVRDELWKRGLKLTTLGNQGNEWWIKYENEHSANVIGSFSFPKVELPKYDKKMDGKICECGYDYERHFDWGDEDRYTGCKYCGLECDGFREKKNYL